MKVAMKLDSVHLSSGEHVPSDAQWRIHVDNRTFFALGQSSAEAGLTKPISAYYAAMGSEAGLTDEMKANRVGNEGRWHIFHLPGGASTLKVPAGNDRRHSFSSLIQLQDGMRMSNAFPVYSRKNDYRHPLDREGQDAERAAAAALDEAMMKEHYNGIVGIGDGSFKTRSYRNPEAQAAAQDFLKAQFEAAGLTTCLHKFEPMYSYGSEPGYTNVVGYIPGETSDTLTVGAHYDSRPFSGTAPGANDNGSGVAALLSVLKAMKTTNFKPKKHLYFVAFAAEEPGLLGSDAFAQELQNGQKTSTLPESCKLPSAATIGTHYAIAVDEIGWRTPNYAEPTVNLEAYDWTKEKVLEHMAQASQTVNGDSLRVVHSNNPFGSDHMSWLDRSMPAVLIINGDDEGYPDYHASTDTMANIDVGYSVKMARLILGGMMRIAGAHGHKLDPWGHKPTAKLAKKANKFLELDD